MKETQSGTVIRQMLSSWRVRVTKSKNLAVREPGHADYHLAKAAALEQCADDLAKLLPSRKTRSKRFYCDRFDLRKKAAPHLYNRRFWHGDGTASVPVTITWISEVKT